METENQQAISLEAPEGRCWTKLGGEEGYRGTSLLKDRGSGEADLEVLSLRPGAGGTITLCLSAPTLGKGLRLSRRCQQLGSHPPGVFADEQPVLF